VKVSPLPLALWVPLASGVALGVPGVIALLTHHLILFASLGPTSVMIAQQPLLASTKPYNTIVGHMIGLGAGFFAVWVLGIAAAPSVYVVRASAAVAPRSSSAERAARPGAPSQRPKLTSLERLSATLNSLP